jgi:hypothetical protein
MGKECNKNGEMKNGCKLLVGNPEGKRPLGRSRCRSVDNVRIDFGETDWRVMD